MYLIWNWIWRIVKYGSGCKCQGTPCKWRLIIQCQKFVQGKRDDSKNNLDGKIQSRDKHYDCATSNITGGIDTGTSLWNKKKKSKGDKTNLLSKSIKEKEIKRWLCSSCRLWLMRWIWVSRFDDDLPNWVTYSPIHPSHLVNNQSHWKSNRQSPKNELDLFHCIRNEIPTLYFGIFCI